jgi:hypothetical protein
VNITYQQSKIVVDGWRKKMKETTLKQPKGLKEAVLWNSPQIKASTQGQQHKSRFITSSFKLNFTDTDCSTLAMLCNALQSSQNQKPLPSGYFT